MLIDRGSQFQGIDLNVEALPEDGPSFASRNFDLNQNIATPSRASSGTSRQLHPSLRLQIFMLYPDAQWGH
jgi:hypothetical protein